MVTQRKKRQAKDTLRSLAKAHVTRSQRQQHRRLSGPVAFQEDEFTKLRLVNRTLERQRDDAIRVLNNRENVDVLIDRFDRLLLAVGSMFQRLQEMLKGASEALSLYEQKEP